MANVPLLQLIQNAGFRGQNVYTMYGIVMAESGGNPLSHNPNPPDDSYGLAQINMLGSMGPSRRAQFNLKSNNDLYDPATNLRVAYALSNNGTNFSPWSTYTSGAYQKYTGGPFTTIVNTNAATGASIVAGNPDTSSPPGPPAPFPAGSLHTPLTAAQVHSVIAYLALPRPGPFGTTQKGFSIDEIPNPFPTGNGLPAYRVNSGPHGSAVTTISQAELIKLYDGTINNTVGTTGVGGIPPWITNIGNAVGTVVDWSFLGIFGTVAFWKRAGQFILGAVIIIVAVTFAMKSNAG